MVTKAQSFPRKSPNTASPMIARHARNFTWNRGCSSNSPPLTHGDPIPHPLEDSDNQVPSSLGRQRYQMPGVCRRGGGGVFKLRFDRYITQKIKIKVKTMLHFDSNDESFLSIIIKRLFLTYQTLRFLIQCFVWVQNVYVIYTNFAYNYFIPKEINSIHFYLILCLLV